MKAVDYSRIVSKMNMMRRFKLENTMLSSRFDPLIKYNGKTYQVNASTQEYQAGGSTETDHLFYIKNANFVDLICIAQDAH